MELHALDGERTWRDAAAAGLRYEKAWFDRRASNWPDLRDVGAGGEASRAACPVHWCHGAVGIGLARLRIFQLTEDLTMVAEAGAALHAADIALHRFGDARHGTGTLGRNMSLCHGLGGLIELFLFAHEVLGHSECLRRARVVGQLGLDWRRRRGDWPCGVPGGDETPGLMLGLAGIGSSLLRLARPEAVPTVTLWR
jgi:lantibiotic modifying enzyme